MSHKRRKWLDDLKIVKLESNVGGCQTRSKKPKIEISSDITIKASSTSSDKLQLNTTQKICVTPSTKQASMKDLTPTFRNPKNYIESTNKVMENITNLIPHNTSPLTLQKNININTIAKSYITNIPVEDISSEQPRCSFQDKPNFDHEVHVEPLNVEMPFPDNLQLEDVVDAELSCISRNMLFTKNIPVQDISSEQPRCSFQDEPYFDHEVRVEPLNVEMPFPENLPLEDVVDAELSCISRNMPSTEKKLVEGISSKQPDCSFQDQPTFNLEVHVEPVKVDMPLLKNFPFEDSDSDCSQADNRNSNKPSKYDTAKPGCSFWEEPSNDTIPCISGAKSNGNSVNSISSNLLHDEPGYSSGNKNKNDETSCNKSVTQIPNKCCRSRRKLDFTRHYIDFNDDDDEDTLLLNEAFPSEDSETNWSGSETTSDSNDTTQKKTCSKKNKKKANSKKQDDQPSLLKSNKKTDNRIKNRQNKNKGKEHVNVKGNTVKAKEMKSNPCVGRTCGNKCGEISEERRLSLFKYFWDLNSNQRRKDWISQCAVKCCVKKQEKEDSRRTVSYRYYINEGEERKQVCQKFLVSTLNVTQRFILYTLETMVGGFAKMDERGKAAGGANKTSAEIIEFAKKFIQSLPLLPSHYCRNNSTRLYLSDGIKNVSNLHRIYVLHCRDHHIDKFMSLKVFSNWFKKDLNISFHKPKKDKCSICHTEKNFDVKTMEETQKFTQHEEEKNESYTRFKIHQGLYDTNHHIICASFDMEKVLCTPYGESMTLYYSRKFAVYNFTVFESGTKDGFCYIWNETNARRGANEIASCLMDYISQVDSRESIKTLILYSDSCYGQNKNKTVLAMLNWVLMTCKNIEVIQMNYLIPGHTYMPVDSMHSTIERAVAGSIVWAPSQWPTIIEFARNVPYKVKILEGKDFNSYENIVNKTFKKSQKLEISKLKIVTFKKKCRDTIQVKYSFAKTASHTDIKTLNVTGASLKTNLYPASLPVSQAKYNDLKKLVEKNIIPKRYANEYLSLKSNAKVIDCLNESDEDDN